MPRHRVISECVDRTTGRRHGPGEEVDFGDEQAARLIAAGCLDPKPIGGGKRTATAKPKGKRTATGPGQEKAE